MHGLQTRQVADIYAVQPTQAAPSYGTGSLRGRSASVLAANPSAPINIVRSMSQTRQPTVTSAYATARAASPAPTAGRVRSATPTRGSNGFVSQPVPSSAMIMPVSQPVATTAMRSAVKPVVRGTATMLMHNNVNGVCRAPADSVVYAYKSSMSADQQPVRRPSISHSINMANNGQVSNTTASAVTVSTLDAQLASLRRRMQAARLDDVSHNVPLRHMNTQLIRPASLSQVPRYTHAAASSSMHSTPLQSPIQKHELQSPLVHPPEPSTHTALVQPVMQRRPSLSLASQHAQTPVSPAHVVLRQRSINSMPSHVLQTPPRQLYMSNASANATPTAAPINSPSFTLSSGVPSRRITPVHSRHSSVGSAVHSRQASPAMSRQLSNQSTASSQPHSPQQPLPTALLRTMSHLRSGSATIGGNSRRLSGVTDIADTWTDEFAASSNVASTHQKPTQRKQLVRRLVGLDNIGNTCFLNSTLQCLFTTPQLLSYFGTDQYKQDLNATVIKRTSSKGQITRQFATLCHTMLTAADYSATNPSRLKTAISIISPQFEGYDQHDSEEFLRYLLDGLHDEMNRIVTKPAYVEINDAATDSDLTRSHRWWSNYTERNNSIITETFAGQFRSTVQCTTCHHTSKAFDPYLNVSLPISASSSRFSKSSVSLDDCIKAFVKQETLTGDEQVYCSKCKQHSDSTKQMSIVRFPSVLVVHLKRFSYNAHGGRSKVNTNVTYPQMLNLESLIPSDCEVQQPPPDYSLFAVSCHSGSASFGHYIAYGKVKDKRYCYNDSHVSEVQSSAAQTQHAYVLFYSRNVESYEPSIAG